MHEWLARLKPRLGAAGEAIEHWLSILELTEQRCTVCRAPFQRVQPVSFFHADSRTGEPGPDEVLADRLCPACLTAFKRREAGFCPYCGEPSALPDAPVMPCGECLQKLPPWDEFLFFGIYEGRLRELILRAKFGGSLSSQDMLGRLLGAVCAEHYAAGVLPDVIVPLPLHEERLRRRGYDQCRELARPVGRRLGVPVRTDILRRVIPSVPQSTLGREQRKNLPQPFAACRAQGLHILLLDDVCTTGATLSRASEALWQAGARRIDAAVLGRASRHTPESRQVALP